MSTTLIRDVSFCSRSNLYVRRSPFWDRHYTINVWMLYSIFLIFYLSNLRRMSTSTNGANSTFWFIDGSFDSNVLLI